jgi:hypothetical protein
MYQQLTKLAREGSAALHVPAKTSANAFKTPFLNATSANSSGRALKPDYSRKSIQNKIP